MHDGHDDAHTARLTLQPVASWFAIAAANTYIYLLHHTLIDLPTVISQPYLPPPEENVPAHLQEDMTCTNPRHDRDPAQLRFGRIVPAT